MKPIMIPPTSPFSAPFSKTAKETGLRIRNLFQWQKRRPPVVLLVAVCGVVLISGSLIACRRETQRNALTEEELSYFREEFFNWDTNQWNLQFLTCSYTEPEDVDLYQIFYHGAGVGSSSVSQEERQQLAQLEPSAAHLDVFRVTADEMNAVLHDHIGMGLDATRQKGLDSFYRLPDWDAYYLVHGDTNVQQIDVTSGVHLSQDRVELHYTKEDGSQWTAILQKNGETYRFQSNVANQT